MDNKILYLEASTGIAGDMTVAALAGLGASTAVIQAALESLQVPGYTVEFGKTINHGMAANTFRVHLEHHGENDHGHEDHDHEDHDHEDHDHEDHDHEDHDHEDHDHEDHDHEDHDHEDHDHGAAALHHHHEHRHLSEIEAIIDRGKLTVRAAALAKQIFRIVAEAESQAHGVPVEEVHFHEVGAIDSIVDIVATAVAIDALGITRTVVTGLSDGTGTIECAHGLLNVPVPAVANIVARYGIPLRATGIPTELVTPTGAAIAAALRTQEALPAKYRVLKIGQGAGECEIGRPNLLRAMLLEEVPAEGGREMAAPMPSGHPQAAPCAAESAVWVLETNVDDATGEQLGFTMELLLEHGARDVHYVPAMMKKSRPGWLLRVLTDAPKIAELEGLIFANTTTIGIRRYPCTRTCLEREIVEVETGFGKAQVKRVRFQGMVYNYPEYESVRQIARTSGRDFKSVFAEIQRLAEAAK